MKKLSLRPMRFMAVFVALSACTPFPVWRDEQMSRVMRGQESVAAPTPKKPLYRLILSTPAQATGDIQLSKFKGVVWDGTIRLQDEAVEWTFTYTNLSLAVPVVALGIDLKNKSEETIEIDWNRSTIVDRAGKVHGIIHKGVKIADRGSAMPPSVIPPGAILEDYVYPTDLFFFSREWWGGVFFEDLEPGQSVSVSLNIKIREQSTKRFVFQVLPPKTE